MTVGIACSAISVAASGCGVLRAVWCVLTVNQTLRKSSVSRVIKAAGTRGMMADFFLQIEIPPDTDPEPPRLNAPPSPPRRARTHSPFDPFGGHNPWAHGEPEDDDERDPFGFGAGSPGFAHRTYRSPDGRFTFSSTTFGGAGPGGGGGAGGAAAAAGSRSSPGMGGDFGDPLLPMVNRLNTIFGGLADTYREQAPSQRREPAFPDDVPDPDERAPDEPHEFGPRSRLFPRDADRAQPMAPPIGTLGE